MAQRADRDPSAEIEIAFASNVIHVTSRTVTQHEIEAPIAGNHVLVEEGLNGRRVVAHDGRRRWSNFFHALHVIRNKQKLYCEMSRREEECEGPPLPSPLLQRRRGRRLLVFPVQMLMEEVESAHRIDGVRRIEKFYGG